MAAATIKSTTHILRSLLILGLIENSNKPISGNELARLINIGDYQQIGRYIKKYLKKWLPNGMQNAIKSTKKGYKFNSNYISDNRYREFVYVLLVLNSLEEKLWDLENYPSMNNNMLGIISTLIISKNNESFVDLKYCENNRTIKLILKPKRIINQNNDWYVQGDLRQETHLGYDTLKLSNIIEANSSH